MLTRLQRDLLKAFFSQTTGFFLTGGAVLAGWHLQHRTTDDLDLFTSEDDAFLTAPGALMAAADAVGAAVESIQTTPDFKRYLVKRGNEALVVDLVRDRTPQLAEKQENDGLVMDSLEEILANKLCALAGRAEIRDLVDLCFIARKGYAPEDHLEAAQRKDGGVTASTLAWVLSQITVADSARLPGDLSPDELRAFITDLEHRLRRIAFPGRTQE